MIQSLIPSDIKVNVTSDDVRLRLNLTTNKTKKFTHRYRFFHRTKLDTVAISHFD